MNNLLKKPNHCASSVFGVYPQLLHAAGLSADVNVLFQGAVINSSHCKQLQDSPSVGHLFIYTSGRLRE